MEIILKSKKNNKTFIIRCPDGNGSFEYWTDSGHGFTNCIEEATRFDKKEGVNKLGELLHEEDLACELFDISIPYECPVKVGTVIVPSFPYNRTNLPEVVTHVPTIQGGSLNLFSPDPLWSETSRNKKYTVQKFLEYIDNNDILVIWDPLKQAVPKNNKEYLASINCLWSNIK